MKIRIGCDIVEIARISRLNENSLQKIFHKTELSKKPESLAGILAAKESCRKVFNDLNWHDIEIVKKKSGRPTVIINKPDVKCDLSISHDGGYAMATVIFMLEGGK
tara:strand:- start:31312 stop:31629 length:318 start_codon:yes stop_codon:yes gene_type:complete